jgi:hypothetical protein
MLDAFREAQLNLRMWPTWKLRQRDYREASTETTWDRMSEEDQKFNLIWNDLMGACREMTAAKLVAVLMYARHLQAAEKQKTAAERAVRYNRALSVAYHKLDAGLITPRELLGVINGIRAEEDMPPLDAILWNGI